MSYPHTTTEQEERDQPQAGHGTPVDGDILDDDPNGPAAREAGFEGRGSTDEYDEEIDDADLGDDVAPLDASMPADGSADGPHGEPAAETAAGGDDPEARTDGETAAEGEHDPAAESPEGEDGGYSPLAEAPEGSRSEHDAGERDGDSEPVAEASGDDVAGEQAVGDSERVATDAAYVGAPADADASDGLFVPTEEMAPIDARASEGDQFTDEDARALLTDEDEVAVATDQPAEDAVVVDEVVAAGTVTTGGMLPGEASLDSASLSIAEGEGLRDRWQHAQLGFIDDPYAAAAEARGIAEAAIEAHIEALRARQAELDAWQSEMDPDTEVLRAAMQGYRDMVTTLMEE